MIKAFILFGLGAVFLIGGIYLGTARYYGYVSSSDDQQTFHEVPVASCNRDAKRPIQNVWTATGFFGTTALGIGGFSRSESELASWQEQQGECPYQVFDIYHLKAPLDLWGTGTGLTLAGFIVMNRRRKKH